MLQNTFAARAVPQTPLGELSAPQTPSCIKGGYFEGEGREGRGGGIPLNKN